MTNIPESVTNLRGVQRAVLDALGIEEIAEDTWLEAYIRLQMLLWATDATFGGPPLTPELMHSMIGYTTAARNESREEWVARVLTPEKIDNLIKRKIEGLWTEGEKWFGDGNDEVGGAGTGHGDYEYRSGPAAIDFDGLAAMKETP